MEVERAMRELLLRQLERVENPLDLLLEKMLREQSQTQNPKPNLSPEHEQDRVEIDLYA